MNEKIQTIEVVEMPSGEQLRAALETVNPGALKKVYQDINKAGQMVALLALKIPGNVLGDDGMTPVWPNAVTICGGGCGLLAVFIGAMAVARKIRG